MGGRAGGGPRGTGGEVLSVVPTRGRTRMPHLDDLRGGTRVAPRPRTREALRALADLSGVRLRVACTLVQTWAHRRDVDDREAARFGRARQHNACGTHRGRERKPTRVESSH